MKNFQVIDKKLKARYHQHAVGQTTGNCELRVIWSHLGRATQNVDIGSTKYCKEEPEHQNVRGISA